MCRNVVLAPLLAAALALGAGCADEDDEGVDAGDGETSTTIDDGTEAGTPSGEVGEVEGEGDPVEGEGTESDDEGPGGGYQD